MTERFKEWKTPEIEEGKLTKWNWMVQHKEKLVLGKKVDIGAFTYINAKKGINIDDESQIGAHCRLYSVDTEGNLEGKITIGKKVKIGCNSTIMPNVEIGDNAIVGAHSFIRKGTIIKENEIWAGCPAKKIGIEKDGKKTYFKAKT